MNSKKNCNLPFGATALGALLAVCAMSPAALAQTIQMDTTVVGEYPEGYESYHKVVIVGTNNRMPENVNNSTHLGRAVIIGDGNDVNTGSTVIGNDNRQFVGDGDVATQTVQVGQNHSSQGLRNSQIGLGLKTVGNENYVGGRFTEVNGSNNLAIGNLSRVNGSMNVALGDFIDTIANQTTVIGYMAKGERDGCVAIGSGSVCSQAQEFSVGTTNYRRRISNVLISGADQDAATVGQLRQIATGIGGGAGFNSFGYFTAPEINFQTGATYYNTVDGLIDLDQRVWDLEQNPGGGGNSPGADGRSAYQVAVDNGYQGDQQSWLASLKGADGRDGTGGSNVVAGSNIDVVDNEDGTQSVSLSDNVELSAQGRLAIGTTTVNGSGVSIQGGPSMTVNGIDAGGRQITNVAPGMIAQDSMEAVNGGQLWDMENRLNDRWNDTNRQIERMGAQSAALTMMASSDTYLPVGKVAAQAGVGMYGNAAAFAVGAKARLTERSSLSIGFSYAGGKAMGGVGYSIVID